MLNEVEKTVLQCLDQVRAGTTKVEQHNPTHTVKAYRVGQLIRMDVSIKEDEIAGPKVSNG